jgi:hypothetical protein
VRYFRRYYELEARRTAVQFVLPRYDDWRSLGKSPNKVLFWVVMAGQGAQTQGKARQDKTRQRHRHDNDNDNDNDTHNDTDNDKTMTTTMTRTTRQRQRHIDKEKLDKDTIFISLYNTDSHIISAQKKQIDTKTIKTEKDRTKI